MLDTARACALSAHVKKPRPTACVPACSACRAGYSLREIAVSESKNKAARRNLFYRHIHTQVCRQRAAGRTASAALHVTHVPHGSARAAWTTQGTKRARHRQQLVGRSHPHGDPRCVTSSIPRPLPLALIVSRAAPHRATYVCANFLVRPELCRFWWQGWRGPPCRCGRGGGKERVRVRVRVRATAVHQAQRGCPSRHLRSHGHARCCRRGG